MSLFAELRRRNVFRVGIAYLIASWVILQVIDVIAPILSLPEWFPTAIFVFLAVGFVPALIFAWAFELTPEGLKKEKEVDRSESITHVTGRKLDYIIISILSVGIVFLLVDKFQTTDEPTTATADASIAVLPFVNMSSDPEQEYFSDGITEEILNALAAVDDLLVAGRTSSFAFKGRNEDLREIGQTLDVAHILEGSVRKSGNQVRITAQLIRVDNGFHLWSETYDRTLDDIFAIQDEIAGEILQKLKAELVDAGSEAVVAERTDPEVYDRYLLAKQRLALRTMQSIESAVALLDDALSIDPEYAPALAQRAIATLLLSEFNYGTIPQKEAEEQAMVFIDRAQAIDPELAEGWAALGLYHQSRPGEIEPAIAALTKAIEINPNLVNPRNWLHIALQNDGDVTGAMQVLEDLLARDPLYKPAVNNAVNMYLRFGELDKARDIVERYRRFDPIDPNLLHSQANIHYTAGEAAAGFELARRARELAPNDGVVHTFYAIGLILTQQLEKLADEGRYGWETGALEWLGRHDESIAVARKWAEDGTPGTLFWVLNRRGRYDEVVNFFEERWSSLEEYSNTFPRDSFGYGDMMELAVAYRQSGRTNVADEALGYVERAIAEQTEAGMEHIVFDLRRAELHAFRGETEEAFAILQDAVERGLVNFPDIALGWNGMYALKDDPRMLEIDRGVAANVNVQRAILGLDPIEARGGAWREPLAAASFE